ncbi:MAG TPA: hypothetical protein VGX28_14545 [Frankiaceae bacterium]|jgi:hypothetical protein|nr:hypothetical protein [Frankiaceae bacterium]
MRRTLLAAALLAATLPATALGSAPVAAPAAARAPRGDARTALAAYAAGYDALAKRMPAARPAADAVAQAAAAAPAAETYDVAVPVEAGDLDGDGGNDVADLRLHETFDGATGAFTFAIRVEAHRGRDGRLLWSKVLPGDFPYPLFTKVGAAGKGGMVVVTEEMDGVDQGFAAVTAGESGVYAYDGAGTLLWEHTAPVVDAEAVVGGMGAGLYVDDLGDLVPGGGEDVLIETYVGTGASEPVNGELVVSRGYVQLSVVDGATGTAHDLGAPFLTEDFVFGTVVGDVSGDRVADVVAVAGGPGERALRARRSTDGAELWASPMPANTEPYIQSVPDMTGDGRVEIVLFQGEWESGTETFSLIDGATGHVLWKPQGTATVVPLGDVDGRRGAEVAVVKDVSDRANVGISVTALTASGRRVWSVTRRVSVSGMQGARPSAGGGSVGDVDADGITDIGYAVTALPPGSVGRRDEGTVDGRTGRVRRDPVADMRGTKASIDGRGSDSYTRTAARGILTVAAWRGDRPARLWETAVVAGVDGDIVQGSFASLVDRDRCADLVVTVEGAGQTTVVLSGATGAPSWALSRKGDAPGVVSRPKVRSTKRYARTC